MNMKNILIFLVGAATGSLITYVTVKRKYEEIANEDFRARQEEERARREKTPEEQKEAAREAADKPNIIDYSKKLAEEGYTDYSTAKEEATGHKPAYIIDQDGFDEENGYDKVTLNYYSDEVLADDEDDIFENKEMLKESGFDDYLFENNLDEVYVRNDDLQTDYEILTDRRTYQEVSGHSPQEDEGIDE